MAWEVEHEGKIRRYTGRMIEAMLRKGDLSGAELAREDGGPWGPLHQTPMFAVVPHDGSDLRTLLLRRATQPFVMHLIAYVVINLFLLTPAVAFFWGIGVAGHAMATWPKLRAALAVGQTPAVAAAPRVAVPERAPVIKTPLTEATAALLADLADPTMREEVAGLQAAGVSLAQRIRKLQALVPQGGGASLTREADQLRARIEVETDARDQAALERELASLTERLGVMGEAEDALERLRGEERTLVHQVEGLRVALASAAAASGSEVDLLDQVRQLRQRTEAEAEVDRALAAARSDAAQRV